MNDDLFRFVPPKPELAPGTKWHVFISYRPSDRPWTLQLYDALRQLGYQVFLDQFVIPPPWLGGHPKVVFASAEVWPVSLVWLVVPSADAPDRSAWSGSLPCWPLSPEAST